MRVSVPSYGNVVICTRDQGGRGCAYVFNLFDGKVGVCRDPDGVGPYVDDDHDRFGDIPLEQVVYLLIRCPELGPRVIPSDHAFSG